LIVQPHKLQTEQTNRGQVFQVCGKNVPLHIGHVVQCMCSGYKCTVRSS